MLEPSALAEKLGKLGKHRVIIKIGPSGSIAEALDSGAINDPENLKRYNDLIKTLDKSAEVVIYC